MSADVAKSSFEQVQKRMERDKLCEKKERIKKQLFTQRRKPTFKFLFWLSNFFNELTDCIRITMKKKLKSIYLLF